MTILLSLFYDITAVEIIFILLLENSTIRKVEYSNFSEKNAFENVIACIQQNILYINSFK